MGSVPASWLRIQAHDPQTRRRSIPRLMRRGRASALPRTAAARRWSGTFWRSPLRGALVDALSLGQAPLLAQRGGSPLAKVSLQICRYRSSHRDAALLEVATSAPPPARAAPAIPFNGRGGTCRGWQSCATAHRIVQRSSGRALPWDPLSRPLGRPRCFQNRGAGVPAPPKMGFLIGVG